MPAVLSSEVQKILMAAMDEIIPAEGNMPSASETGGLNYLLKLLKQFPDQAKRLEIGLVDLNNLSNKSIGKEFDCGKSISGV